MSRRRPDNGDAVTVKFTGGATLAISFTGNMFNLTHDERELVASVTSIVQDYAKRKAGAPGLAQEAAR